MILQAMAMADLEKLDLSHNAIEVGATVHIVFLHLHVGTRSVLPTQIIQLSYLSNPRQLVPLQARWSSSEFEC
jgi:hypothetical protein